MFNSTISITISITTLRLHRYEVFYKISKNQMACTCVWYQMRLVAYLDLLSIHLTNCLVGSCADHCLEKDLFEDCRAASTEGYVHQCDIFWYCRPVSTISSKFEHPNVDSTQTIIQTDLTFTRDYNFSCMFTFFTTGIKYENNTRHSV